MDALIWHICKSLKTMNDQFYLIDTNNNKLRFILRIVTISKAPDTNSYHPLFKSYFFAWRSRSEKNDFILVLYWYLVTRASPNIYIQYSILPFILRVRVGEKVIRAVEAIPSHNYGTNHFPGFLFTGKLYDKGNKLGLSCSKISKAWAQPAKPELGPGLAWQYHLFYLIQTIL